MKRLQRVVIVTRKSRLQELHDRFNTASQARFYLEQLGESYDYYQEEHETTDAIIHSCKQKLATNYRLQAINRTYLPNFIFTPEDIVITIGNEGLVANTLKYLNRQFLIPISGSGRLSKINNYTVDNVLELTQAAEQGDINYKQVNMAKIALSDGQSLLAVNDFFLGTKSHTSANYQIENGTLKELHSSSGILVSTGFGSTGWLQSVIAGAIGITGHSDNPDIEAMQHGLAWDSTSLIYSVREPFPAMCSGLDLIFGSVDQNHPLKILSRMGEDGVIFSDGMLDDYIEFNAGITAEVSVADKVGLLAHG